MAGSRNNTHINCNHVAGTTAYNIWRNECDPCEECIEQIPNIRHWYRYNHGYQKSNGTFYDQADILTNITDGGNLKGWYDQITGTNHLIAAATSDQPKYEHDDKSFYFKSALKYLDFTTPVAFAQDSDWTVAIRYKHQYNTVINASGITLFSGVNDLFSWKSTTSFEIQLNGGTVHTITGPALDPNVEHNFVFKREGNVLEIWVHGVFWGTSSPVDNGPMDLTHVGSQDPESENLKGYVTHISMYDRALDAHEIYCLESTAERVYAENNGNCSDTQYTNGPDCESNGETWTATLACVEPEIRIDTSCVTCYNGQDGTLTANLVGGVGPYTYAWTGPNGYTSTSNPMTGAASGVYTVTITDTGNSNTTYTESGTICNPPELTCTVTAADITGGSGPAASGSVTVVAIGGTPTYTYQWSTGGSQIGGATSATYTTTVPGVYTVTVTDANACTTTCQETILNAMDPLSIQCAATDLDCDGDTDGGIDIWIDPTTVTYPVSVQLDTVSYGGTAVSTTAVSTAPTSPLDTVQLSSLGANTYYITVTDSSNTPQIAQCTTTITAPPAMTAVVTVTNATICDEACNGEVLIVVSGGTSACGNGYEISISDSNGVVIANQTTNSTNFASFGGAYPWGWCADTYTYLIKDCNDCSITGTFDIECPVAGDLTITTTDAPCDGNTGSAEFTVSNNGAVALSDYQVTVSSSASITYTHNFGTTHPYTDTTIVPGTTYTALFEVLVNGSWVFLSTQTFVVGTTPPMSVTVTNSCNGLIDNGYITGPSHNTGGLGTNWKDQLGYMSDNFPAANLALYMYENTQSSVGSNCPLGPNGGEYATVTDIYVRIGLYPTFTGGNSPAFNTINDLIAWMQANGCSNCVGGMTQLSTGVSASTLNSFHYLLLEWSMSQGNVYPVPGSSGNVGAMNTPCMCTNLTSTTHVTCFGGSDGAIDLDVSGGSGTYTYAWTGPNGFTATTQDITGLPHGDYQVIVTDSLGCTVTEIFTVNDGASCTCSAYGTDISCNGLTDGTAHAYVNGCDCQCAGNCTYAWTGPNSFTSTASNLTGLAAGTYDLTVTGCNGCTSTCSVIIGEPAAITTSLTLTTQPECGACNGQIDMSAVAGGTPGYSMAWNVTIGGVTTSITATSGPGTYLSASGMTLYNVCEGSYSLTVTDTYECEEIFNLSVTSTSTSLSMSTVVIPINECGNCCGDIHMYPTGGTPPYTYLWAPAPGPWNGVTTQDIDCTIDAGPYTITLTDSLGCSITNTYTMTTTPNTTVVTATYDATSGNLTATASGGTAPYTYQWSFNNNNFATGATVAAVGSGYYCVTVSDANGCKATDCISVTEPGGRDLSWECEANGCQGYTVAGGTYSSLQDCLDNCENVVVDMKWICFENACTQTGNLGQSGVVYYNSYGDCIAAKCGDNDRLECDDCECPDCEGCPGCSCNEATNRCEPDQADDSPCEDPGTCEDYQQWNQDNCECECTEVEECEEATWNPVSCRCE